MNTQFLRDALYVMKIDYGQPGQLIKIISESTNSATGERTVNAEVKRIPKVVLAPLSAVRKFFFDLSYMKANNNFTYGGDFDVDTTVVFIDAIYGATIENEMLLDGVRYQIAKVEDVAKVFTILTMKAQKGQTPYNIINAEVSSTLQMQGGVTND